MISNTTFATTLGLLAALVIGTQSQGQAPSEVQQTGPGVQAPRDSKYPAYVARACKNPPAPPAAPAPRPVTAGPPSHRDYSVTGIPGVIAPGAVWSTVWTGTGNNADGPIATDDGGVLFAQNSASKVMKLDRNGVATYPHAKTNTGGSLARSKSGALVVLQRGLPQEIWQLEPRRKRLASRYRGEPLDCTGGLLNDLSADSKGGVYFTMGGVYHSDPKGIVTRYGGLTGTNGIILSRDEKTLYVTGRLASTPTPSPASAGAAAERPGGIVAYDVQTDGSLTNERQFALVGADGSAIDEQGRIYTTAADGVYVIDADGKLLGEIPTPLPLITVVFSGPGKKTLYGVANTQRHVEIFTIPMVAQGYSGRAK